MARLTVLFFFSIYLTLFYVSVAHLPFADATPLGVLNKKYFWGVLDVPRGGDEKYDNFVALLKKAQIDPSEVFDGEGCLTPLKRLLEADGDVDLFLICNLQSVYESKLDPSQREKYMELKNNFVKEMDEHLKSAGIGQDQEWTPADGNKVMIDNCISLLKSDYLQSSMFQIENFRQQVMDNPMWKAIVKTALLTRLGDDCPKFDEIIQDSKLFGDALLMCIVED